MKTITTLARTASWIFVAFGIAALLILPRGVRSWSPTGGSRRTNLNVNHLEHDTITTPTTHDSVASSRRQLLQRAAATVVAATATIAIAPQVAGAACLYGDTRPVCIGIYKVPQDAEFANYISTPEQLKQFAPDLVYVPPTPVPKSFESALEILRSQLLATEAIRKSVAAGELEEAGVVLLGLIPYVTTSGKFVLDELQTRAYRKQQKEAALRSKASAESDSGGAPGSTEDGYDSNGYKIGTTAEELAIDMASNQMDYVNGYFGECDIVIGQGIRGDLGVSAVAQLTILSTLRDATGALDDFLATASTLGAKM